MKTGDAVKGFHMLENSHKLCQGSHQAVKARLTCFISFIKLLFSVLTKQARRNMGDWGAVALPPPLFCRATKTKMVNYLYLLKKRSINPPLKISFRRACKEKDYIQRACVYLNFFHETVTSHNLTETTTTRQS